MAEVMAQVFVPDELPMTSEGMRQHLALVDNALHHAALERGGHPSQIRKTTREAMHREDVQGVMLTMVAQVETCRQCGENRDRLAELSAVVLDHGWTCAVREKADG